VARLNRALLNPALIRLVGRGPFAGVEHRGRRSGRVHHTPIMAFRHRQGDEDTVTIALTYGPGVDWLRNVQSAHGCRMVLGPHLLTLGAPTRIDPAEGLRRMPALPKVLLPILRCRDFVHLPVLDEKPVPTAPPDSP